MANGRIKTLQHVFARMIRRKEESIKAQQAKTHESKQRENALNEELINICSNPNDMDVGRMEQIKKEKSELESQRMAQGEEIKQIAASIESLKTLQNEITNEHPIDPNVWIKLSSNKNEKVIKTKSFTSMTPPKKQKFKRPVRTTHNKPKEMTMSICDVLPKKLCPIKLSTQILSNGTECQSGESMFDSSTFAKRQQWIKEYNEVHLNEVRQKFKSIYGINVCLNPLQSLAINDKKRRLEDDEIVLNEAKKQKMTQGEDECINNSDSDFDDGNDDTHTVLSVTSSTFTTQPNMAPIERQNKQTLNVNTKYNPFKPMSEKRHRVRSNRLQTAKHSVR